MLKELFMSALKKYFNNPEEICESIKFKDWEEGDSKYLDIIIPHSVNISLKAEKRSVIVQQESRVCFVNGFNIKDPDSASKIIFLVVDLELRQHRSCWRYLEDALKIVLTQK